MKEYGLFVSGDLILDHKDKFFIIDDDKFFDEKNEILFDINFSEDGEIEKTVFESNVDGNEMSIKFKYTKWGDFYIEISMSGNEILKSYGSMTIVNTIHINTKTPQTNLYQD